MEWLLGLPLLPMVLLLFKLASCHFSHFREHHSLQSLVLLVQVDQPLVQLQQRHCSVFETHCME
jgi:hypothetical protein